ncbi:hypothetical protein [Mycolicibacterium holsaticum]|uniref:FUSC family protein n=1 Tax=Mycolicibacterium holsaticum TaxID=152142 RepID=A0A1E3R418_9MYCO|nr:hypothetical protein [Mycolicibacterium holsaticum]ODQ84629.1 hypothetical protein BHQ17_26510 [Mycolicibacterium holsaticum]
MTGPEDSSTTRPISVAELLARNGTIGAPPLGGRRRRRRGDTDSITVAELTGEIPIIRPDDTATSTRPAPAETEAVETNGAVDQDVAVETEAQDVETEQAPPVDGEAPAVDTDAHDVEAEPQGAEALEDADTESAEDTDDDYADAVADYAAYIEHREKDPDLDFFAPPLRSSDASSRSSAAAVGAEQMSPDPVVDWADAPADEDDADLAETDVDDAAEDATDGDELPSYLRSTDGPLFGGQTVADDLARRGVHPGPEDIDLEEHDEDADTAAPGRLSAILRAAWVVGQCVIAVAFGAGLFIAFDQLWKWNNIIALVLSVLVILGLVVGVRVVRKTEDIGSTLIAVAVGALVTLGPLALLQSG